MNSCAKSMRVGILEAGRRDVLQGTSAKALCMIRLDNMSTGFSIRDHRESLYLWRNGAEGGQNSRTLLL